VKEVLGLIERAEALDMGEQGQPTIMVVVGAGASTDSISIVSPSQLPSEERPPLTDGLFTNAGHLAQFMRDRQAARSLAASVAPLVGDPPKLTLEEALTAEFGRSHGNPVLTRGFTSLRFYLRDLFSYCTDRWGGNVGGSTNYSWLARELETWRGRTAGYVLWVTFNYDGLLDRALEDLYNYDFGSGGKHDVGLGTFTSRSDWALLKLHGSCDWRRRTSLSLAESEAANSGALSSARLEVSWAPEMDPPTASSVYARGRWNSDSGSDRALWIPALMAPLAGKSAFECPEPHSEHLRKKIPEVDLILTVGWRAQEKHFLGLLSGMRRNPPDVYSLAKTEAEAHQVAQRVGAASGPHVGRPDGPLWVALKNEGFSALVLDHRDFATTVEGLVEYARQRRHPQPGPPRRGRTI
jgi:hypothetical protein